MGKRVVGAKATGWNNKRELIFSRIRLEQLSSHCILLTKHE
jgi:hypothetical protein